MFGLMKLAGIGLFIAMIFAPMQAAAQNEDKPVEARFVGVAGGAIAGGEIVIVAESLFKVKPLWPYLTFPLLGAAGGGVGGYFLEQESPKGAVALLIASLALVVPTALAASAGRAYDPEEDGAVGSDLESGGRLSFELAPGKDKSESATTTEVESRPEGADEQELPPPGTMGPPAGETPAPAEDESTGVEGDQVDSTGESSQNNRSRKRAEQIARAGSLVYFTRDGDAQMAVPFVDIRPVSWSYESSRDRRLRGVEVLVSLLRVDLP